MGQNLSAGPEILGLIVLGGAIGAILGGAGPAHISLQAGLSAATGSLVLPALLGILWPRRARQPRTPAA